MGHRAEPEKGLPLLIRKLIAGDRAGTKAIPGVPAPPNPRGGGREPFRGEVKGDLELQGCPATRVLGLRLGDRSDFSGGGRIVDGFDLIGEKFFDLIHRRDRERRAVFLFGQRGAPFERAIPEFDDRADGLSFRLGDALGGSRFEFEGSDQSLGVKTPTFF